MRYLFEEYSLDTDRRELRRGSDIVPTTPQVFDLLDFLIRNRDRVVSKDDLVNAIWSGRIITDAALATRLNAARSAIGDTDRRLIRTSPRKGFRFVGSVEEAQGPAGTPDGPVLPKGGLTTGQPSAPRLSIIVLPFANLGGDPEQDYFVDGVTESLTTDLSRIKGSFVIGRHTAYTYKDKTVDIRRVGGELNVRYALEGSMQRGGNRLRVNARLTATETGNQLWAERFDKPIADLLDMQDEIVARLANALDSQLAEAEARRAERVLHPDAMDLFFQGRACLHKGLTNDYLTQARSFFERALTLDPDNVEALVGIATVEFNMGANFFADDRAAALAAAETALTKALSMAPQYVPAISFLGNVHIYTTRVAQGITECEQALALDRNLTNAHAAIGMGKIFLGRAEQTEAHIQEALRLSPRDIFAHRWMMFAGAAKLFRGDDAEAVVWLRRSVESNRNFPIAHFCLAAALALLGSQDEARTAAQAGLELDPAFSIHRYRVNALSDNRTYLAGRERIYQGMRLAGVPEA
ncbi:winged helix-turn-helix domain-containing protein [Bradyrhizobium diazoefficiens]|nr:winged helix-turn-helix domain-containing protein [Bradyrhizobium diazoefficiens]MBR0776235.1 winged helix-turn-helix domain-containing protein [Bradyrhizobium diazoefficiens]